MKKMKLHDGLLPIIAGAGVVSGGVILKHKLPVVAAGLVGFGLAHITMGATCYMQEEYKHHHKKCWSTPLGKVHIKL